MCQSSDHIIFCTCSEKEPQPVHAAKLESFAIFGDKEAYHSYIYKWDLLRVRRKRSEKERYKIIGEMYVPLRELDEKLTARFVVEGLNSDAEFDFEYMPQDGDELYIYLSYRYVQFEQYERPPLKGGSMRFAYEHGAWHFGYVDGREYEQVRLNEGEVKLPSDASDQH